MMDTPFQTLAECVICGLPFEARTSYGLCPFCVTKDKLREFDRLVSAKRMAERSKLPATLTLVQWLSVLSDFNGMCAYCGIHSLVLMEMVNPFAGLTYENVVPACKSCHDHKLHGFDVAVERVRVYLSGERVPQLPLEEEVSV